MVVDGTRLQRTLVDYQRNSMFTDLRVVCSDGELDCHRALLSRCFQWPLPPDLDSLLLPDLQSSIFQEGLEAFYLTLNPAHVTDVLYSSCKTELPQLVGHVNTIKPEIDVPAYITTNLEVLVCSNTAAQLEIEPNKQSCSLESSKILEIDESEVDSRYQCTLCEASFRSLVQKDRHMSSHREESSFPCEDCNEVFVSREHLKKHMRRHELKTCAECDVAFDTYSDFIDHKKLHSSRQESCACNECGKVLLSLQLLKRHIRNVHTNSNKFTCDYCEYKTNNSRNLKRHTDHSHLGICFQCPTCDAMLASKSSLFIHSQKHKDDRPWICSDCGDCFKWKKNLEAHMDNKHGVETLQCPHCPKTFKSHNSLEYHMRFHDESKQFPCAVCGKRFVTKTKHRMHQNIHTGEKPFKCAKCGKCYHSSDQLSHHKRSCVKTIQTDANSCSISDKTMLVESELAEQI